MVSKEKTVENFNTIVKNLMEQIITLYPDCKVSTYASSAYQVMKTHKTKLLDQFILFVYEHQSYFEEKNTDIFLKDIVNTKKSRLLRSVLSDIRAIWNDLSLEDQDSLFEYMQVLCKLCSDYILCIV